MQPHRFFRTMGLALLLAPALAAQEQVRFVLAPRPLIADPVPDVLAPPPEYIEQLFREAFERSIPGGHRPLRENDPLSSRESTLVVVPRITALRCYRDSIAGTLDHYKIMVVGEVALLDPWSMGRLYAATRMVYDEPGMGRGKSESERDGIIRASFQKVIRGWTEECLRQIQRKAHPFVLRAAILPERPKGLRRGGGIWPFGSLRGVEKDKALMAESGKRLKVREVYERFSVVEDPDDAGRVLNVTDEFRLTVIRGDVGMEQRQEPRLQVRWMGAKDPMPPDGGEGAPLTREAWLGLAASYLSKDGRFRVLPVPESEGGQAQVAWAELKTLLQNRSNDAGFLQAQSEVASRAAEDPDVVVGLGILDAYHGSRPTEQGGTEHLYRNVWGMAWSVRQGNCPLPVFSGFGHHSESLSTLTKEGIREMDGAARWFLACRDGLVKLIEGRGKLIQQPAEFNQVKLRGRVLSDRSVQWEKGAPPRLTRLEWRHPQGEVTMNGQPLGTYFEKGNSLRWGAGADSKVNPGDVLLYSPEQVLERPLISLRMPALDAGNGGWLLDPEWIQPLLARELSKVVAADFVLWQETGPAPGASHFILRFGASPPTRDGNTTLLKSAWRLRLYGGAPSAGSPLMPEGREPLFKLGRERLERFADPSGPSLQPSNQGLSAVEAQEKALFDLITNANSTGLQKALFQENQ